jgi:hypothetical protein
LRWFYPSISNIVAWKRKPTLCHPWGIALIAFLPNLDGSGHLLLLQGLDVAGTQAAAETLFHPAAIAPILRQATRPDGSLRFSRYCCALRASIRIPWAAK